MSDLQTATDIVAISFMGVVTLFLLVMLIAALAIKKKVSRLQSTAQEKIDLVRNIPYIGKQMFGAFKKK